METLYPFFLTSYVVCTTTLYSGVFQEFVSVGILVFYNIDIILTSVEEKNTKDLKRIQRYTFIAVQKKKGNYYYNVKIIGLP